MLDKIKKITNKKAFNVIVILVIIIVLLFILGVTMLEYNENGETNMPFNITKISIISSSEGIDKKVEGQRWAFDINQNNDIYLYIEKNENYKKSEVIESVVIDNFKIEKASDKGETKIYKPDSQSETQIFTRKEENVENSIKYVGGTESKFKNLKISNQGDILAFRCANEKVASYQSADEDKIDHGELLKKSGVKLEDLKITLSFTVTINLNSGKSFQGDIKVSLPVENIVEKATTNQEITDLKDVVFKRIKN